MIVFDIDGTLADITHRLHYIQKNPKDWEGFFGAAMADTPIREMWTMLHAVAEANVPHVFASGRPERTRGATMAWLCMHGYTINPMYSDTTLFMRSDGDRRPDYMVKLGILNRMRSMDIHPTLVFDDRQQVVDMWRKEGIRVAQVAKGDY